MSAAINLGGTTTSVDTLAGVAEQFQASMTMTPVFVLSEVSNAAVDGAAQEVGLDQRSNERIASRSSTAD